MSKASKASKLKRNRGKEVEPRRDWTSPTLESANHLLLVWSVLISLLWLRLYISQLTFTFSFDLRLAPPELLGCVVLCLFFSSILSRGQETYFINTSTKTADKFVTVVVGNGSQG
nr:MAG: movement protein 2 [Calystegia pelarspovirus 1]